MVFLWFFYMFAFFAFSIAPLVIIWLIWRKRFKRLTEQVAYLAARIQDLEQQISSSQAASPSPKPHVEHPPHPEAAPAAKLGERVSPGLEKMGVDAADWEAVIGGKWLNKIGIVVFVIGVALFLGYSLRYMGPLGRVATGVGTSLPLLC